MKNSFKKMDDEKIGIGKKKGGKKRENRTIIEAKW